MMKRYEFLKILSPKVSRSLVVVGGSNVGDWISLEPSDGTFACHGMVTPLPIAIGLALALPRRRIIALTTDGAVLMGLGALVTLAETRPSNLSVIVFDNELYEGVSKGEIPTHTAMGADIALMAKGAGLSNSVTVKTLKEFERRMSTILKTKGTSLTNVKVEKGAMGVRGVYRDGTEIMYRFVRHIEELEKISIL